jgi:hypothetical protein
MTITASTLSRAAGLAAIAAGLLFTGVQINHPHLDAVSLVTTEVVVRNGLKMLMAVLALAGITGMYLRQVRQTGILGLLGYLVLGAAYALILGTSYVAAFVLPEIAPGNPAYVNDVVAATTGGSPAGDIGVLATVLHVQTFTYLVGGLVFGIALFRARVFPRWPAALLAAGGVVTVALSLMPDAFYRLLAYPNGIAMVALGWSLWRVAGDTHATLPAVARLTTAGAK